MLDNDAPRIYYPYACLVCLRASPDIKRCSNCKLAAYCSKHHQISNWQHSHKHLCKIISHTNRKFTPKVTNFEEWTNYRLGRMQIWGHALRRQLNAQEIIMNQFSPHCIVCYSRENLYPCKNCLNVSYCCEEHETMHSEEHKKFCEIFRLSLISDQFNSIKGLNFNFCCKDLKDLITTRDILKHIKIINLNSNQNYLKKDEELLAVDILKSESITLGLNLLYALNLTNTKQEMIFHIIGASTLELETNWPIVTNILQKLFNISYIKYYMIGPDINTNDYENTSSTKYEIHYHSSLYHEIIDEIEKPDLIAAFNCGFHEYEEEKFNPWSNSIPKLFFYKNVPLLMTSFTQTELIRDRNIVLSSNEKLNVICDIKKNPFAFLKPLRDWLSKDDPIFYRCNYIYVIERKECKQ